MSWSGKERQSGGDDSEDEDEVLVRDGRELKRPLMAPRRRCPAAHTPPARTRRLNRSLALFALICVGVLAVAVVEEWPAWTTSPAPHLNLLPPTLFSKERLWSRDFPGMESGDSLILVDINSDSVDDIVFGFASREEEVTVCREGRCGGGAVALDGKTGATLWETATRHQVLFIDCSASLDQDQIHDCLLSGRSGVLCAVNGKSGEVLWEVEGRGGEAQLASAQMLPDQDGDTTPDVLAVFTFPSSSRVSVLSGRSGVVVGEVEAPDRLVTLPRMMWAQDDSLHLLLAAGTPHSPGSLYSTPLYSILRSDNSKLVKVWGGESGVSCDLVLVDLNQDRREDVVVVWGDSLAVLNPADRFSPIWNLSLSRNSRILVGPTPGYFDGDSIPDLLVTSLVGPSLQTLYYSETQVLSGKDGSRLLEDSVIGGGDVTGEAVSLSFTGNGNDMFLFWLTSCRQDDANQTRSFTLPPGGRGVGTMDLCQLRFNTSLETRLYLLSDHIRPPGHLVFSSNESRKEEEPAPPPPPPPLQPVEDVGGVEQPESVDAWDYADSLIRVNEGKKENAEYDSRGAYLSPVDYRDRMVQTLEGMEGPGAVLYEDPPPRSPDYPLPLPRSPRRTRSTSIPRSSTTPVLTAGLSGGMDAVYASHWMRSEDAALCLPPRGWRRWEEIGCRRRSQLSIYRDKVSFTCYRLDPAKEICSYPRPVYSQSFSSRSTHQYFRQRL